ncbi:MAG: hypothetical protein K2M02_06760 [Duncaniella sp.]|nr:hypothetical protein [Duncaniella sp.]
MKIHALIITATLAISVSCGHKELPRRGLSTVQPETPGDSLPEPERPGLTPADIAAELNDPAPRFTYGDIALRYDNGGTLFTRYPDGSTVITDLDGIDRITLSPGTMREDSTFSSPRLTVTCGELTMLSLSLLKRDDKAAWYRAMFPDSTSAIIVLPTDI